MKLLRLTTRARRHLQGEAANFWEDQARTAQQGVLAANRALLDLAVAYRVALECPEIDIRDDLDFLIRKLTDQVAVLEELIV
jgi:hypothetical protein